MVLQNQIDSLFEVEKSGSVGRGYVAIFLEKYDKEYEDLCEIQDAAEKIGMDLNVMITGSLIGFLDVARIPIWSDDESEIEWCESDVLHIIKIMSDLTVLLELGDDDGLILPQIKAKDTKDLINILKTVSAALDSKTDETKATKILVALFNKDAQ
jgi:hypothetical protein